MKKIFISFLLFFIMSCSSDSSTAKLELKTIQCLMCSAKIEESVAKIDGVKNISVDLKGQSGKVVYKASLVDMSKIEDVITELGYDVNGKKADPTAYQNLELCCKKPQ